MPLRARLMLSGVTLDTVLSQAAVCELHPFIGFGFIA